jgi:hypothetical protein
MSNCIQCIKNKRTGSDLLCDECRKEKEVYCHACSKAGGAERPIYHLPPPCAELDMMNAGKCPKEI